MNIAVCLFGASHDPVEPVSGDICGRIKDRDWKRTAGFIKSQIIDCWEGHQVKTYIATYDHPEIDAMLDFYKPEKYVIAPDSESNMILTYLKGLELLRGTDADFIITTRPDIKFFKKLSTYNIQFDKFNFFFKEWSGMWDEDGTHSIDTTGELTGTIGTSIGWDLSGVRGHTQFNFVVDTIFMCPFSLLEDFISAVYDSYYDPENRFSAEMRSDPRWGPNWIPGPVFCTLHGLWNYLSPKIGRENIHFVLPDRYFSGCPPISEIRNGFLNYHSPPWQGEYFVARLPDACLEPWNHKEDWISFINEPIVD